MRPWAEWTAKTALLAAGFAAAGGGLSGAALAGTGDELAVCNDIVTNKTRNESAECGDFGCLSIWP